MHAFIVLLPSRIFSPAACEMRPESERTCPTCRYRLKNSVSELLHGSLGGPPTTGLIAIIVGLERTLWCNPNIGRLIITKSGQFDPKLFQMEAGDFFIEMLRQHINFVLVFARFGIGEEFNLRQRLVGKGR